MISSYVCACVQDSAKTRSSTKLSIRIKKVYYKGRKVTDLEAHAISCYSNTVEALTLARAEIKRLEKLVGGKKNKKQSKSKANKPRTMKAVEDELYEIYETRTPKRPQFITVKASKALVAAARKLARSGYTYPKAAINREMKIEPGQTRTPRSRTPKPQPQPQQQQPADPFAQFGKFLSVLGQMKGVLGESASPTPVPVQPAPPQPNIFGQQQQQQLLQLLQQQQQQAQPRPLQPRPPQPTYQPQQQPQYAQQQPQMLSPPGVAIRPQPAMTFQQGSYSGHIHQ